MDRNRNRNRNRNRYRDRDNDRDSDRDRDRCLDGDRDRNRHGDRDGDNDEIRPKTTVWKEFLSGADVNEEISKNASDSSTCCACLDNINADERRFGSMWKRYKGNSAETKSVMK